MRKIVIIAHDIRSTHNVGALFRTCDGLGIAKIYLTGYSPYPKKADDERLPHLVDKIDKQIHKTALGAETNIDWEQAENPVDIIKNLKLRNYHIIALEQAKDSVAITNFQPPDKIALLLGNEVDGLNPHLLKLASTVLEIPMYGSKESFNVIQAAAMALYHLRFYD